MWFGWHKDLLKRRVIFYIIFYLLDTPIINTLQIILYLIVLLISQQHHTNKTCRVDDTQIKPAHWACRSSQLAHIIEHTFFFWATRIYKQEISLSRRTSSNRKDCLFFPLLCLRKTCIDIFGNSYHEIHVLVWDWDILVQFLIFNDQPGQASIIFWCKMIGGIEYFVSSHDISFQASESQCVLFFIHYHLLFKDLLFSIYIHDMSELDPILMTTIYI